MSEARIRLNSETDSSNKNGQSQKYSSEANSQLRLLNSGKARLVCASVVFAFAIALYSVTLAPTVTLVDSGELIVSAYTLGVAHPPGFPLYTILAHLATLIPLGNIAERVNFASAIAAALACAVLTLLVFELLLSMPLASKLRRRAQKKDRRERGAKKSSSPSAGEANVFQNISQAMLLAPGLLAGLLFACSRSIWAYATIAEVYTLNTLLIVTIFYLMMRWRRGFMQSQLGAAANIRQGEISKDKLLYAAALLLGLALGVHHVTIALMVPAIAFLAYRTGGIELFKSRRLLKSALFALAGLAVYIYLPLAASRSPLMNWGDPQTVERFWWHVTGRQYQVFLSFSLETMIGQFDEFLTFVVREFGWWWMPLGLALSVAGFVALFRFDKTVFWFLVTVTFCDLAYALNYDIAEDKDAYYLPIFLVMTMATGAGMMWITRFFYSMRIPGKLASALALILVISVASVSLASSLPYNNRSRYYIAEDYIGNILNSMEQGGMLLTLDWQVYSPMLYLLDIEKRRPDIIAIDVNQLRRSWYFDYLRQVYPDLIEKTRDKVDAFLEDLILWENDSAAFDRDLTRSQRINARFYDMILSFVSNHVGTAPVYATEDLIASAAHRDAELTRSLTSAYQPVPRGLVFQLMRDRTASEPVEIELVTRGLNDGTLKFEKNDVINLKVLPVYVNMSLNHGIYLAAIGRREQAIGYFRQALALDPENSQARRLITENRNKLQQTDSGKMK